MTQGYKPKNQLSTVINHTSPNSWELQDAEIERLVKEYMQGVKYRPMYADSIREGWDWYLWSYIRHVAEIQAQMITGAKVGFDSMLLFGKTVERKTASQWLDEQRGYCASGIIDVHIPAERVDAWKRLLTIKMTQNGNLSPKL